MTKILIGVAIGYLLSDWFDDILGKEAQEAKLSVKKDDDMKPMTEPQTSQPPTADGGAAS